MRAGLRTSGGKLGSASSLRLSLVLLVPLLAGCATARGFASPGVPLRITSNVPDAAIWVDDQLVGKISDLSRSEKRLPPGFHRIEIRAPGYYSSFHEVEATVRAPVDLAAPLHQLLD